MKKLIIIFVIFLNCSVAIIPKDTVIVCKKIINSNGNCNYTISIPRSMNIYLTDFSCDCYDVGDTINFQNLNRGK